MRILTQNAAATVMLLMVDSTNHVIGKTGLSLTVTISKNGAGFSALNANATVAELTLGWYAVELTANDTDTLGDLAIHGAASGADPSDRLCVVEIANPTKMAGATFDPTTDSLEAIRNQIPGIYDITASEHTAAGTFGWLFNRLNIPPTSSPITTIPAPPASNLQTLYGRLIGGSGSAVKDIIVTAIPDPGQVVAEDLIDYLVTVSDATGVDGIFSLTVVQGAIYTVRVPGQGVHKITINTQDTENIATYILAMRV